MKNNTADNYLFTEVMTSTPQKLQLMLLDAAIREGELARKYWHAKENKQAEHCLLRAQRIMTGVLGGIDYDAKSELVGKVAGVYLFICQALTRAFVDNDEHKLDEALHILYIERETWRQLCEKIATSPAEKPPRASSAPITPHLSPNGGTPPDLPTASFSLEA